MVEAAPLRDAAPSGSPLRHKDSEETLHEMLIVLGRDTYVRPHRHGNKSESFHVVEGALTVVIFADDGAVNDVIRLGEYRSGRKFFYRLAEPAFHTILVESASAVIHETTNGPFDREATEYAVWAPAEGDEQAVKEYLDELTTLLDGNLIAA